MISAGIYGTIDLAKDINQGTLIQYEKEEASTVKSFVLAEKKLAQSANTGKVVAKNALPPPTPKVSDLKIEYFSRGEPPMYSVIELLEIDSAKKSPNSAIVAKESVTVAKAETEKEVAVLPVKEERKFSPKLFSRGRPRPYKKEEVVVAQTDTLKKE